MLFVWLCGALYNFDVTLIVVFRIFNFVIWVNIDNGKLNTYSLPIFSEHWVDRDSWTFFEVKRKPVYLTYVADNFNT